jgi:hypothetical protein
MVPLREDDLRSIFAGDTTIMSASVGAKKQRKANMTKSLVEQMVRTLNVGQFISGMAEWDDVTRRQCLSRALREISTQAAVGLHGARAVKRAMRVLSDELGKLHVAAF